MTTEQFHQCARCASRTVRLYRPYGEFLSLDAIFCKPHIPAGEMPRYVPLLEREDGTVIGGAPGAAMRRWQAREEGR